LIQETNKFFYTNTSKKTDQSDLRQGYEYSVINVGDNSMNNYSSTILLVGCFFFILGVGGCAASRALNKEQPKDFTVLKNGTERDLVIAELGTPLPATENNRCDLFSFTEGSGGYKYMRAVGYSVLAVGTLGISETFTNPAEASIGKDKIKLRVCYDEAKRVASAEKLEAGKPAVLILDPTKPN